MALYRASIICYGALMVAAVFVLQAACLFFPVFGPLLSAAGTVFVAASAVLLKRHAVIVYLSAGLLILAISPRYAADFLFTTGLVGLSLGLCVNKSPVFSLLVSSLGMFSGLCCLTFLLGTATLVTAAHSGFTADLPIAACLPVYAVLSIGYSIVSSCVLQKVIKKSILKNFCQ